MTFDQIPMNTALFVDANTLVYHFTPDPVLGPACQQLLTRIAGQELLAYTSTHVLSEVAHRMMTLEAIARFGWPLAGIGNRLRRHPAEVCQLGRFRQVIDEIPRLGISVLTIAPHLISLAGAISQQTGLLSNDALIVALMQQHGLTHLASHDADFDRVAGLTRYAPV